MTHNRNCYLSASFYRRARRSGVKKAITATAHELLIIAYYILRDGTEYQESGGDYFDRLNPGKTTKKFSARLERLGYEVVLKPMPPPEPQLPVKNPRVRPRKGPIRQTID